MKREIALGVVVLFAAANLSAAEETNLVGRFPGGLLTPVNQRVTPFGKILDLPGLRPQGIALSRDGKVAFLSGKTPEILVVNTSSGAVLQRVALPSNKAEDAAPVVSPNILRPDTKAQLSFTGLILSPKGDRLYLSDVNGSIKVFSYSGGTNGLQPLFGFSLPPADAPRRKQEIPAGLAISTDGSRLYIACNLGNRLAEADAKTGKILRSFDVGVAPYDVVLVRDKAYVSNWGGRRPKVGDVTGPAGRGTEVIVDPVRFIGSEGSVSVISLSSGKLIKEIPTGMHASALAVHPSGQYVVCANATSDNLSVIHTGNDTIIETIWAKKTPADLLGASPNALAFDDSGKFFFVANGTQNAIGVVQFRPGKSRLIGLVPAGWFPAAIAYNSANKHLYVCNLKGLPLTPRVDKESGGTGFNTHHYSGSLSWFQIPANQQLAKLSTQVYRNFQQERLEVTRQRPRRNQPPRPVPERIGEPSVFKHVVYIIKENRTYDQVLGDDPRGNGDPALCIFGARITPNQHKMAKEFVLFDNTYCAGILSADGHQWSTTAFGTDYLEKSFAGWPRSYPDGMGVDENDALAYAPSGFIWDNVLRNGKTLRNYGEFAAPDVKWRDKTRKGSPDFLACWRTYKGISDEVIFQSYPMIESIRPYQPSGYVGWDMAVPDQYRADFFINELKEFEKKGTYPNLTIVCLPNDHTSGTSPGSPTPAACMADNDLAFGRMVEALSHSKFWRDMVIFAIEDDPQAGWDHVSGYRTTAYVISPYTKRGAVVSTLYNTTSMLRTIGQILGLPPMNQFDASALPMADCFIDKADFTPFKAVPNNVPLDQMNPDPKKISDALLRKNAIVSSRLNFKKVDACPEDIFNRILWHAMKGSKAPYPEWAIDPLAAEEEEDEDE